MCTNKRPAECLIYFWRSYSTCLWQVNNEGIAWDDTEWHEEREAAEPCGCWKGISSSALTFRLFVLEQERALNLLCCDYTKRGLRHPAALPPTVLTYSESTLPLRDKKGSAMFTSTEACKSLLMSLFFLRGPQKGCKTFGCSAKNNKWGGSCVREEADRPRNQRWLAKKGIQHIKGVVPRNWSE